MVDVIKQRHGSIKDFMLNLVLLGVSGVLAIQLATILAYQLLPVSYFLQNERITVTDVSTCDGQKINTESVRRIYPYLPEDIAKQKTVNANVHIELFSADGRKIDEIHRMPVIEWKQDGINQGQLDFNTTLLPGQYYLEYTANVILPTVGERAEPIRQRSNTFSIELCKPLELKKL